MKLSFATTPARGVFGPLVYAGDMERGIRRAGELGYEGIELNLRDPSALDLDAIAQAAVSAGVQIVGLGTGQAWLVDGLSASSPDSSVRVQFVERLRHHVDFAARVGAFVIVGNVRGRLEGEVQAQRARYAEAVVAVQQVADYAAPKGVSLFLEPINRYESNFVVTAEEGLAFMADVGRPNLKLLLDTFHMNIEEVSMTAAFEKVGDRLGHVHLVDSNRCAPGMGHTDFRPIIAALRAVSYDGYLSGEFLPFPNDDAAVERNLEYVRRLLAA